MTKKKNYSRFYNQKAIEFTAYITSIRYQFYFTFDDNQIDANSKSDPVPAPKPLAIPTINL